MVKVRIENLTCPHCTNKIENYLQSSDNISYCNFDAGDKVMMIKGNISEKDAVSLCQAAIDKFEPGLIAENYSEERKNENDSNFKLMKIIVSAAVFAVGFALSHIFTGPLKIIGSIPCIGVYIVTGLETFKKTFRNLLSGNIFDENFLMTTATLGAVCLGEFSEAAAVMLLFMIGEFLEEKAVNTSQKSVKEALDMRVSDVELIKNEKIIKSKIEDIKPDDLINIKPGERIPLDCVLEKGEGFVNTFAITGESVPRKIKKGDTVLSGYINGDSVLELKVTADYKSSTASKIIELVNSLEKKKSKSEKFITKFAKYYTPIVCAFALLVAIVPPVLGWGTFGTYISAALTFLVISCPCALVISVPLAYFSAIGKGAKMNMFIKSGEALEKAKKITAVAFDKTGTLTEGIFEVSFDNIDKDIYPYLSEAEGYSTHPVAKAISSYYHKYSNNLKQSRINELSGYGIEAVIDGKEILIGNDKLMKKYGIDFKQCNEAGTVCYVSFDGEYKGYILISDKIKDNAKAALSNINKKKIVLSGDNDEVVNDVKNKLDFDIAFGKLLPEDKVNKIKELKTSGENVAFVGDGINDAPVLMASDLGISMGNAGSDAAINASDVVLMDDDLKGVSKLFTLAKVASNTVKINIAFALSVKAVIMALGLFGISSMWLAVIADVGVSLIAVANSVRILRRKI